MPQLTSLQAQKVNEILALYNTEKEVHFKAPTGSGKTLMATSFISNLINNYSDSKFIFVIATISSSDLPKQFERKINEYKQDLPCSDFEVEYIESPSKSKNTKKDYTPQIRLVQNKVYIFGKSTFGKDRIFTEQEIITDFIQDCKTQEYKIVYIRDEAHIGGRVTKDAGTQTFETLMNERADFTLKMTATFDNKSTSRRVELLEKDLKNSAKNDDKWLVKCNLQQIHNNALHDEELIDLAINEFTKVKEEYQKLDCIIKPAMLIQVDNEPKDSDKKIQFHHTLQLLKDKLTQNGLSWVQYFGNNDKDYSNVDNADFALDKITRKDDPTNCIIFKIGPATGWDIPRACMLLQLRNVCSSSLNIQTIGRIKRNPYPNLVRNDITDKYYIFTNAPTEQNRDYRVYQYTVKQKFEDEEFAVIKMQTKSNDNIDKSDLTKEIDEFIQNNKGKISIRINEMFVDNILILQDKKILIKNPILVLKYIKTITANLNSNQRYIVDTIKQKYLKYFTNIQWEKILIVLCNYFTNNISQLIKKCINKEVSYNLCIENIKPQIYTEVFQADNHNYSDISNSNYLFSITEFGSNSNIQHFDSSKERIVVSKLKTYFETIPVKIWVKNPTSSNIYGEYLDEYSNNKKSYFDFVLKFNNGNYLYLEIKGDEDDIDINKTQLLEEAYTKYFENINYDLWTHDIAVCILNVDSNGSITPKCFYDKTRINECLNGKTLGQILQIVSL